MPFSIKYITITIILLLTLGTAAWSADEGELSFLASADRTQVGLDNYITLTVSVSGKDIGGISQPDLPSLDQFEIVGTNSSTSSQFSLVNGKMTSSKTIDYIYTLRPKQVGQAIIGAATLSFKGKTYQTEPIEIDVIAGSVTGKAQSQPSPGTTAPPPPLTAEDLQSEDLFLRADFDRKAAYPGQQVTVTYTLYNRTNLSNVQYDEVPTFPGFWVEEIYVAERLNFQQQVIGGKRYQVAVLKKLALFPTTSGQVKVEPMQLICDVRSRSNDIFDFFGRTKRVRIANKPASITVESLPLEERPEGFTGSVGQYSIKAGVDHRQTKTGEPLEFTVEIRGKGNLKTLPTPQLPSLENFKAFEPEVQEKISKAGGAIGGTKTYTYVLIPREQGSYRIDAIELAYFDPADKSYHTVRTEPIEIEVLPGEKEEYPLAVGLGREEIKLLGRDIRYIKPAVATLKNESGDLYGNRAFQTIQIIPLLAVLTAFVARKRRDRISRDIRYARWRRAMRRAREGLRSTKKLIRSDSSAQFYGALSKTLCDYIGDKLNLAASGITSQQLREELGRRKADDKLVEEILDCLSTCDYSRFAPATAERGDMETMLRRISDLIARLEKSDL